MLLTYTSLFLIYLHKVTKISFDSPNSYQTVVDQILLTIKRDLSEFENFIRYMTFHL